MFIKRMDADASDLLQVVRETQAVISFTPDGVILSANQVFLDLMGYKLSELAGKHHRMFLSGAEQQGDDYADFWGRLRRGERQSRQFSRVTKTGQTVWLQASYTPVRNASGKVEKVIKCATDITPIKMEHIDLLGKVNAIMRSQAVIEFSPDGMVLTANQNFLDALGYRLDEITGKHHRIFVPEQDRTSEEYTAFWATLRQGQFQASRYRRIRRDGSDIWIQATYNPVFDLTGTLVKVVKFATDVTEHVRLMSRLKQIIDVNFSEIDEAIVHSNQMTQATGTAASSTLENVQTIAAGTQQLVASINEISASISQSQQASDQAKETVATADSSVVRLVDATQEMSSIVSTINGIAAQINLLALNATIESARAGVAGKGFSVVAGEVKTLATQAAQATGLISRKIDAVQAVSSQVVMSLDSIRRSIDTLRQQVVCTASAVEEQSIVTRDISNTMQAAASSVGAVTQNVVTISAAVAQAQSAFERTREAAAVLSH
ncbi:methyl-accepting chemotaxis protein [Novispirillum itersonii]|uniref:methyl-accepting chemotaxis protein n=1 Tax=Novispirillum itersonii TaxID=189 RepID=UPI000399F594|nr:PAS domain-containing methyl-accepting chemotaxis protein [Novispirillum itersonii]